MARHKAVDPKTSRSEQGELPATTSELEVRQPTTQKELKQGLVAESADKRCRLPSSALANENPDSGESARVRPLAVIATTSTTTTTVPTSAGFQIFAEEAPAALKKETKRPPAATASTTTVPTGAGFQIFAEEAPAALKKDIKRPILAHSSCGFSIFTDEVNSTRNAPKFPHTPEEEEKGTGSDGDEINNILDEMGILDAEDATINTRLARNDIDSMFCSPGSLTPVNRKAHQQKIVGFNSVTNGRSKSDFKKIMQADRSQERDVEDADEFDMMASRKFFAGKKKSNINN